jgi:hypothetical protein
MSYIIPLHLGKDLIIKGQPVSDWMNYHREGISSFTKKFFLKPWFQIDRS